MLLIQECWDAADLTVPGTFFGLELPVPQLRRISNIRIVTEKILDVLDPPRFVPDIGVAQLHRAQYRSTVYFDAPDNGVAQLVVYLDHDHYHFGGEVHHED